MTKTCHLADLAVVRSSCHKLLLFYHCIVVVAVLWLGSIVSIVCSIVLSKGDKPLIHVRPLDHFIRRCQTRTKKYKILFFDKY